MVKFLLGVAMVAFTTFCGYLLSKKYRKRKRFFHELHAFNEQFLSEIAYSRRPIKEFVAGRIFYGEINDVLSDFFLSADEGVPFSFANDGEFAFLKEDEKRRVEEYFRMLGRGDSASQKQYFSSVKASLEKSRNDTESESKKYGDLYIKLGFLCGLLILILIV